MNYVEPIRDAQKVRDIQEYLKRERPRDYIMFITGVYTGLRISDILKLRIKDIKDRKQMNLREEKTNKQKIIELNPLLKKEYGWYCLGKSDDEYLIKSRESVNKSISRDMAYKCMKRIGEEFEVLNIGTHSLRKTFGYHYYKKTKNIAVLQELFNHSSPNITLKYIGIKQDTLNKALKDFKI